MMDHFGVDRAVLMGWSMGVNTMFELALRHPERVSGLFAVPASRATPSPRCSARSALPHVGRPARSRSTSPGR